MNLPRSISILTSDPALVERAQRGDGHAFAVLYRRHVRYVMGILRRLIRPDASADLDDMLQQTFADAYFGIARLRNPSGFRPWLARIAARCAYDRLTARTRLRWLGHALQWVMPRASNPRDCDDIEALSEAVEWIGPELGDPWVLHAVRGETLDEVARASGVSLSTVKRRIGDAQQLIDKKMRGQ
jgi:RNA polymerase sigma-70 factor, ECF subfamily